MAERSDYLYAQVRKKVLDAVRMDLIGPTAAEEALTELPTNSYITGICSCFGKGRRVVGSTIY